MNRFDFDDVVEPACVPGVLYKPIWRKNSYLRVVLHPLTRECLEFMELNSDVDVDSVFIVLAVPGCTLHDYDCVLIISQKTVGWISNRGFLPCH